jgi:hypothetical protein
LTVESLSPPLSAPSTRVVATLLFSGSDRRHESRERLLVGSLTTTSEEDVDGGAVLVTDDLIPGLDATNVPPPPLRICDGRSQIEPYWTVPGTTVVEPGAQATGTFP